VGDRRDLCTILVTTCASNCYGLICKFSYNPLRFLFSHKTMGQGSPEPSQMCEPQERFSYYFSHNLPVQLSTVSPTSFHITPKMDCDLVVYSWKKLHRNCSRCVCRRLAGWRFSASGDLIRAMTTVLRLGFRVSGGDGGGELQ
jgi:hypothetical protein